MDNHPLSVAIPVAKYRWLPYILKRKVTKGDVERRIEAHFPRGYRFASCNRRKRTAKFVSGREK